MPEYILSEYPIVNYSDKRKLLDYPCISHPIGYVHGGGKKNVPKDPHRNMGYV